MLYVCIYTRACLNCTASNTSPSIQRENQLSRLVSMDHCFKSTFLLILLLLFTSPSSAEIVPPSDQVGKIAATSAYLAYGMKHVNPRDSTVNATSVVRSSRRKKKKRIHCQLVYCPHFMMTDESVAGNFPEHVRS